MSKAFFATLSIRGIWSRKKVLEGKYVIQSEEQNLGPVQAVEAYKELSEVERSFRELKDLVEMRPIYHHRRKRVRAHIFVAVLAFLLSRALEKKLKTACRCPAPRLGSGSLAHRQELPRIAPSIEPGRRTESANLRQVLIRISNQCPDRPVSFARLRRGHSAIEHRHERPIKVGDVIEVGGNVGEVSSIGIRASIIRTAEGSEIIVPNGSLISSQVTNWTLSDRKRAVEVSVNVAGDADPQRVIELLKSTAASHPAWPANRRVALPLASEAKLGSEILLWKTAAPIAPGKGHGPERNERHGQPT